MSAPLNLGTLSVVESSRAGIDGARARLDAASAGLRSAFSAFTSHSRPIFTTTVDTRPALQAAFAGTAARLTPIVGSYSVLQSTVKVNTQTSTVRSSASPIGFDLTAAHSRLTSNALGLDVTSAERASTLTSTSVLGLNVVDAASTITSTGEMNAAATSLGSAKLSFAGSTSQIEISGAYSGNATSLTFRIGNGGQGSVGADPKLLKFDVLDQAGNIVASHNGQTTAGQQIDLSAVGLKVRFTAGNVSAGDTASTAVWRMPTQVDTAAAFNAGWGAAPLFENFQQVTSGAFTINGVAISVSSSDSIDSVLSRINGAGAGVTASVSGDRVLLASNGPSESGIVLGTDSSGFLQATKLSAAAAMLGNVRDDQQVLSQTTQFGSVASGSFLVNGVSIAVDAGTDSLATVLARINGSGAGVVASYDADADRVVLASAGNSEDPITVSGDSTGLVAAAGLSTAVTATGNVRDDLQALSKTSQFAAVTGGTFQINGRTIAVDAERDSLSTVIQTINDASAGVAASFNAATNRLELESVEDSEDPIVVGADSTGLLAIAGLDTANTVLGSVADDLQTLSATAAFAAVTAGSFTVNGVAITVDPDADTLDDVLARVNGAGAGVTASYDSATDRVTFTPAVAGATLALTDDTSGFLAAAQVASGVAGTRLDPDAAFDSSTGNGPMFDPGVSVGAGSFSVNGITIAVAADDSVNSVLARINASGAGVTATFDSATQLVRLTSDEHTASPIALGADSSGFLAAMKLDGTAQSTAGAPTLPAFDSALASFAEYAGVSTGTLTVNGQQIAIDPQTTTVRDLVTALDSVAGIDATLDEWTGALRVASTSSGGSIQVADTSGILDTLGIAQRTYNGSPAATTITEARAGVEIVSNSAEVAASVSSAADEFTAALTELARLRDGDEQFLADLVAAAGDAVGALRDVGVGGLTVGGEGTDVRLVVDRGALATALDALSDPAALSGVVADTLNDLAARVGDAIAAPAPAPPSSDAQTISLVRPELAASQAAAAALFQKALARVVGAVPAERQDAAAPGDGALDMESRMRIAAQLRAPEPPHSTDLGNLLESLAINVR